MTDAFLGWAMAIAWQAGLLAAVACAADLVLARRGFARLRHALWLLVLVRFVLPPSLAAPWSVVGALRAGGEGAPVAAVPAANAWPLAVWACGVLVVASLTALRSAQFHRRVRAGAVAGGAPDALRRAAQRMGLRRLPRVVVTSAVTSPALAGWLRPVLLVPASGHFAALGPRALEHVFLHELSHLRRRDLHVAALATLVRCAAWFHPAAWLAARRTDDLREVCCDLDAAEACGDAAGYRDTLLDAAARLLDRPAAPALAWLGHAGIVGRLDALASARPRSRLRRAASIAAFVVTAACALPMAAPDDGVAVARQILADAASGRAHPSCLRLQYAAMVVAASESASSR